MGAKGERFYDANLSFHALIATADFTGSIMDCERNACSKSGNQDIFSEISQKIAKAHGAARCSDHARGRVSMIWQTLRALREGQGSRPVTRSC